MNTEKKLAVLQRIAEIFNHENIMWAAGGSLLLYFRRAADAFHDIDLMIAETDIIRASRLLDSLGERRKSRPDPKFRTRYFLEYVIDGIDVDVMAGFAIVKDGREYDCSFYPEQITGTYLLQKTEIPLQCIELWKQYYELMDRPEKAALIDRMPVSGGHSEVQKMTEGCLCRMFRERIQDSTLRRNVRIDLDASGSVWICPDFYSEKTGIIGEIHSHPGKLKAAQRKKIAADILKMLAAEHAKNTVFRKYIIVCDEEEKKELTGKSYLAYIIAGQHITVECIPLPEILEAVLAETVRKQDMLRNRNYRTGRISM